MLYEEIMHEKKLERECRHAGGNITYLIASQL